MVRRKRILLVSVALTGFAGAARGQGLGGLGGAPAVPAAPSALSPFGAAPTALPAAAAPAKTIWGFLGLSKSNLAACKLKLCASPAGQMLNSTLTPLSALSGGMIPVCCPTVPTAEQVAALAAAGGPTGAEAVAAKIKQDEADAKARRAAVRYLSTVDCHYWPEAEAAIIGALRDDRNECVRYEAALALLNGCCCTEKTIEALKIVLAAGTPDGEKDGKPFETSERVKGIAMAALQNCLLKFHPPLPPAPAERAEQASATRTSGALSPGLQRVAYYYVALKDVPPALIAAEARRTIERLKVTPAAPSSTLLTGKRSVYDALARAAAGPAPELTPTPPADGPAKDAPEAPRVPTPPPLRLEPASDDAVKPAEITHPAPPPPPVPASAPIRLSVQGSPSSPVADPFGGDAPGTRRPPIRRNLDREAPPLPPASPASTASRPAAAPKSAAPRLGAAAPPKRADPALAKASASRPSPPSPPRVRKNLRDVLLGSSGGG